ncbi:MAG: hypothetical protein PHV59_07430, partial [Victivallales bacterium]|nr:hypothetical protein [Victivallales bacterium]
VRELLLLERRIINKCREKSFYGLTKDNIEGKDKKIIQGVYIHDFGSGMKCRYPVPISIFKKSILTVCEHLYDGTLDGVIIPQAGWFSDHRHFAHISWMKSYFEWFDGTVTCR